MDEHKKDVPQAEAVAWIPLERLIESTTNPRSSFDAHELRELAASIQERGIILPLIVRETPDFQTSGIYEIVAGARRFRAAKIAKLRRVPALVRALTEQGALLVQQVENLQREDVTPLDEARGYQQLLAAGFLVPDIERETGKKKSQIYGRLAMLRCIPAVIKAIEDGRITASHAVELASVSVGQQAEALEECLDLELSVKDLQDYLQREQYRNLHAGPWKKDDGALLPKAGPCTACIKNTNVNAELRDVVKKRDVCTDGACFHAKLYAWIKREGVQPLSRAYNRTEEHPTALRPEDWKPAKKTTRGAARGVVVEGGRDVGAVYYFVKVRHPREKKPTGPTAEQRQAASMKRAHLETKWRTAVLSAVLKNAPEELGPPELTIIEKRLRAGAGGDGRTVAKRSGALSIRDRILALALADDVKVYHWHISKPRRLLTLARRYRVNANKIRTTTLQAEKKPKELTPREARIRDLRTATKKKPARGTK